MRDPTNYNTEPPEQQNTAVLWNNILITKLTEMSNLLYYVTLSTHSGIS